MGTFVVFQCTHCRYEEAGIAVGRGRNPSPRLALYRCPRCKTVGSTWVHEQQPVRCGACYEEGVTLLADDTRRIDCPKCGQPAGFRPAAGSWE